MISTVIITFKKRIILLALLLSNPLFAQQTTSFLCGPDEDGCSEDSYQSCICILTDVDAIKREKYYLDLDHLICKPIRYGEHHDDYYNIIQRQDRCLATLFQSEPDFPCPEVSNDFCNQHNIPVCIMEYNANIKYDYYHCVSRKVKNNKTR